MKPHQLHIEAFGPFATAVEIDFDSLSQEGLFLIHGRTGAGKTFLLDALCFALYGEVSGDRNVRGLKSDHAAPAAAPRVSLAFSAGGRRYRVSRSPAWSAPRSRGEGTIDKPPQAVLERLLDHGPEPISSRSTEVTREVESLVGLNAAQFRQVILLPQGRFAEVLRARAEEREALLKTLFDTVLFEQAGRWLEERAKAERLLLLEQERGLVVLRQQALQEWRAVQEPEMQEGAAAEAPPQDQQGLDQLRQRLASLLAVCGRTLQETEARWQAAQTGKSAQDDLAARWDRRAAARARLEDRESRRESVDAYRQRLSRAEQAEALRGSLAAEQQAREQLQALKSATLEKLRHTAQAREAGQGLPASLLALDLSVLPEPMALAQASNDLAARRVEVQALVRQQAEASGCRAEAQRAAERARQAGERLQAAERAIQAHESERRTTLEALQRARSARDQIEGLELAAQQTQRTADAAEAIGPGEAELAGCTAEQLRWERETSQVSASLRQLQKRQIDGMALRLAGALSPGSPCPVCGSAEHPSPARGGSQELVDAELTLAEQRLQQAENRSRSALAATAAAQSRLQALREQAGTPAQAPAAARQQANTAMAALQAARQAATTVPSLETAIQAHDARLPELQGERQAAGSEQAVQSAGEAQQTLRATTLEREIRKALGEGIAPEAVLAGIDRLDPLIEALQRSGEAWSHHRSQLEQASDRLTRELAASPFADAAAAREALQAEHTRQHWATRIQAYEEELLELRGQLASPDLADLPETRPDTATAQAEWEAADQGRTRALTRQAQVELGLRETARLCDSHRQGSSALEQVRARAELISAVADRCQGRTTPYISLQRWVLSAYLAEICGHANRRLEQMTAGRYQLRLSDEGGRGGRQAGLALRVLDAYTGEEREVSSLSGGETFQASLALALGVADTVESHAGGLRLETLFIDEGFGTLDPDTLQLAMDELDRLRDGGRLIGIISHVGALRERIHTGIEVLAGERGSSLRVGRLSQL